MKCPMQNGLGAESLMDLAAGKLDESKRALVEQHLSVCPSCTAFVEDQRALWNALEYWDQVEISADFNRRLFERIEQEDRRALWSRWAGMIASRWSPVSWRAAAPVAAACFALVIAWWAPPNTARFAPGADQTQPSVEKVDVEQVERALEDLEMLKQFSPPG